MVITNRNASIFDSTKATLELIYNLFNCQSILIHNKVVNDIKISFKHFLVIQSIKLKIVFLRYNILWKKEWIVPDDIHSHLDNTINKTKTSSLDFYIQAHNYVENWIENTSGLTRSYQSFRQPCFLQWPLFCWLSLYRSLWESCQQWNRIRSWIIWSVYAAL